jgi:hypothetical protein
VGTTALIDRPGHGHFLAGELQQSLVLTARRRGIGNGPVYGSVFGQEDERRPGLSAGLGALGAYWFLQVFRERASRIQDVSPETRGLTFGPEHWTPSNCEDRQRKSDGNLPSDLHDFTFPTLLRPRAP